MKEYVSPVPKTPLRNVMTPDRPVPSSALQHMSVTDMIIPGSASRSKLTTSFEALNDDENEKMLMKDELRQKRKERATNLLSPVVGSSPKAAPPQNLSSKSIKRSTSGTLVCTPVASVISSEIASRPIHSSNGKPKMTAEQMNKVFEEWIKIAADNVKHVIHPLIFFYFILEN